jgi:transposase
MNNINVVGIDLAKNVFQIHGNDKQGKCLLRKRVSRQKLLEFMAQLPSCLVGIEACGGAHYWGRTFQAMGHTVKIMAPQFVKPYVKSNKTDRNDAEAIAEAVTRPNMRFVPIKTVEQQDTLLVHRARELVMRQRTAQANQIRGLLTEYGIVVAKGIQNLQKIMTIIDENKQRLSTKAQGILERLCEQFKVFETEMQYYNSLIEQTVKQEPMCQAILKIEGVGPITASAITATIGDAKAFKNGREVSAWLGLVPKQNSSGDKVRLGGITKRGDRYVRKLLVHGARCVVKVAANKTDRRSLWINDKRERLGFNRAAVALANKNARVIWAMLATGEAYRQSGLSVAV